MAKIMISEEDVKRYVRAHRLKGLDTQLDITLEELAELIQAIIKFRRTHDKYDSEVVKEHVAEEIADVEIMCEQLRVSFGSSFSKQVNMVREHKLERLDKRLNILETELINDVTGHSQLNNILYAGDDFIGVVNTSLKQFDELNKELEESKK